MRVFFVISSLRANDLALIMGLFGPSFLKIMVDKNVSMSCRISCTASNEVNCSGQSLITLLMLLGDFTVLEKICERREYSFFNTDMLAQKWRFIIKIQVLQKQSYYLGFSFNAGHSW